MRPAFWIGLMGLMAAEVSGANKPIPQDFARMEKSDRDLLEWNRRSIAGAYDKVGKKDPKWDKAAREALELAARAFSFQVDPVVSNDDLFKASKAAIDLGCDDPYVTYLLNRSAVGTNFPGEAEAIRRMQASAKALASSRYPAFRRAGVLEKAGDFTVYVKELGDPARAEGRRDYDDVLSLLPESLAIDERGQFWENQWFARSMAVIRGYRKLGMEATAAYQEVDAKLAKIPGVKVLRLQVRGSFWSSFGWEARTTAFAPDVPQKAFDLFHRRVLDARKAYLEAWKLRPDDARSADALLGIEKAIGGDRAAMELWFERAMKADGNMRSSCLTKLDWLDPKWHGTPEEMLAFGKACAATKNWKAGITLLACDAHARYSDMMEPAERTKYLDSEEVWSEVSSLYDEFLEHYPNDFVARSKYASLAFDASRLAEAHAQFEILGDRLASWSEFPYYPLETLKRMRANCRYAVVDRPEFEKRQAAEAAKVGAAAKP